MRARVPCVHWTWRDLSVVTGRAAVAVVYPWRDLLQKLLEKDPIKRIGCGVKGTKEIKTHEWYATLDWEKLDSKGYAAPWVPPLKGDGDVVETEEYWDPVFQADSYSWEESDWCQDF